MKKRTIMGIALISLFTVLVILAVFTVILRAKPPLEINFVHDLSESETVLLTALTEKFTAENGIAPIDFTPMKFSDMSKSIYDGTQKPDIFLWRGPVEQDFPFDCSGPRRWMGTGWTLAVNRSIIPENIYTSLVSADNMDAFEEAMNLLKEQDITPLSVGDSHLWPLSIWSQHIMISLGDGDIDYVPGTASDDSPYRNSWETLRRWKDKGFFLEETWNEGWPGGVAAMAQGQAAMTLLSDTMLTAISPDARGNIEFIPFPRGNRKPWLIGAGLSIIVNEDSPAASTAEALMKYLTDPAVTEYLTFQLQRFFYSAEEDAYSQYVASWQELSNSREMREYGMELKGFVEK